MWSAQGRRGWRWATAEGRHWGAILASRLAAGPTMLADMLEREWGHWFLWAPVAMGVGVAVYFALPQEPSVGTGPALVLLSIGWLLLARRSILGLALGLLMVMAGTGFTLAKLRTELVRAPVIEKKRSFELTGLLQHVSDRGRKGRRLTLKVLAINGLARHKWPKRVRIVSRLQGTMPAIGSVVRLRAVLRPPPEPVAPGGYDFARKFWFAEIGGIGFALSHPQPLATTQTPFRPNLWDRMRARVQQWRLLAHQRITTALPGTGGGLASALVTGERASIPETVYQTLRDAGLAHVLAISGMHMGIVAGTLFWLLRALFALSPNLALHFPIKKWAAALAIIGAAAYLLLSGASIATQRAFVMTSIMLLAILLDRPAISLRNVALAALVILVLFPESLLEPGFQMSFAAATALVAFFEWAHPHLHPFDLADHTTWWRRSLRMAGIFLLGIFVTDLIASLAVAPFAIWHFQKFAAYSLAGNLMAMPVITLLVMPMVLLTMLFLPFGLEAWPLALMGPGLDMVLMIARMVAGWPGAAQAIATPHVAGFTLVVLGGLWLCLWRENWRLLGGGMIAAGILLVPDPPRPDILVERTGRAVAVRSADHNLTLMGGSPLNFGTRKWFAADGDPRLPDVLRAARIRQCDRLGCIAPVGPHLVAFAQHPASLEDDCRRADILVARFKVTRPCQARLIIDRLDLWAAGAHAIYLDAAGQHRVETVNARRGRRPWVQQRQKRHDGGKTHPPPPPPRHSGRNNKGETTPESFRF